jgi:biotin operon repressor
VSDSVFDRDKRIRSAALTMPQTFYLVTLNQFVGNNADAWPSQQTIANAMNATSRAVRKWQTELEQIGVIQVNVGKGRSLTNRYRLNLDSPPIKEEPRSALNEEPRSSFTDDSEDKRGTTFLPNEEPRSYEMRNHVPTERTLKEQRKNKGDSIPESLNSEPFRNAWGEWLEYRRQRKQSLTSATIGKQLKKLAAWGPVVAVQSIEQSIEHGWQGLFELKSNGKPAGNLEADQAWQTLKAVMRKVDKSRPYKDLLSKQLKPEVYRAAEAVGFKLLFGIDQFNESKLFRSFTESLAGENQS